jgi:autotransporter-associated beta strand protein
LSGDNINYGANTVRVNAGTLILDYGNQNNTKLDASVLVLSGGTLTLSGGSFIEDLGSARLDAGASSVTRSSGTAGLQMNVLTRNVGSTIDFGANGIATTDNGNVNGILGGWATVGGTTWAIDSALDGNSAINGLTTYETSTTIGNWGTTENISIGANPSANLNTISINSLRFTGASTVTINDGQTLTLTSGGILGTGSGAMTITGGTLRGANIADLVVIQNSPADMTIGSVIANQGTTALTKSGTGRLILSGANTYSGQTYVNQGILSISANNNLGAVGTGAAVNLDGGTLQATATFALNNGGANHRAVTLADNGGTIDVTGANTLAVSGNVTGVGKLTKTGTGVLALSGAGNTFSGGTTLGCTLGEGEITLGANNALGTGGLEFAGGILNANNRTVSMGVLSLTADSTLNLLDDGTTSSLTFSSAAWTDGILTITGWSGIEQIGSDDDAILISATPNQDFLSHVRFQLDSGLYLAEMSGNELVPGLTPVPEPTEWALMIFATLAVLYKFVWPRLRGSLARG